MTTVRPSLQDICAPVADDLREYAVLFKKELDSKDPLISGIHDHLLKMTGKGLRPILTVLSSRVENKKSYEAVQLAVAIELIHTATLIHDDIIDQSELRRNQPSLHSKWGTELSIVAGDYLYAKAFLALSRMQNTWVNEALAACAHIICEGEMKQIEKRSDFGMPEEQYFKIIHQKTAALFQAACAGGAYFSGTTQENIKKLADYGYRIGMAFQIVDDCLDITGETEKTGKTAGLDIYKNDVTLPLLYLFSELTEADRKKLLSDLRKDGSESGGRVRELALETGSIDRAMAKAREHIEKAYGDLECLRHTPYRASLYHLATHCLERSR